jgi:hypothetical protein
VIVAVYTTVVRLLFPVLPAWLIEGEFLLKGIVFILLGAVIALEPLSAMAQSRVSDCGPEMKRENSKFLKNLRKQNFYSKASSNKAAKDALIKWLTTRDKVVIKHEKAHQDAAGKWGGQIAYLTFQWYGRKYATAGCHKPKSGIPLNLVIKSALAPEEPSSHDLKVVAEAKKHIKIKSARAACKKGKKRIDKQNCLKQYRSYKWLDKYPK